MMKEMEENPDETPTTENNGDNKNVLTSSKSKSFIPTLFKKKKNKKDSKGKDKDKNK